MDEVAFLYRDDLIRGAQAAKNYTLKDLAKKTGITSGTLSLIRQGKAKDVKVSTLLSICSALDLTMIDIFTARR